MFPGRRVPAHRALLVLAALAGLAGCERVGSDRDVLTPYGPTAEGAPPAAIAPSSPPPAAAPPEAGSPSAPPTAQSDAAAPPTARAVTPMDPSEATEAAPPPEGPDAAARDDTAGLLPQAPGGPLAQGTAAPPTPAALAPDSAPRWASAVPAASALVAWPLHQVALIATVPGGPSPLAVVRLPDGSEHVVRVGSVVGDTGARVSWIGPDQVSLAEVLLDPSGRPSLGQRVLRTSR